MLTMTETMRADERARAHWNANLSTLARAQGALCAGLEEMPEGPWTWGRDGFLTARPASRWLQGCSVPMAAARQALERARLDAPVLCFALASHGAQVQAALDRIEPRQGLIVVVQDEQTLRWMLGCADFSAPIAQERLFFLAGEAWAQELATLLGDYPGLPTPTQFIRMPWAEEARVHALIETAQRVFEEENERRTAWLRARSQSPASTPAKEVCVFAPKAFRLWNDGGWMLQTVAQQAFEGSIRPCDADRPTEASVLALARASQGCRAVVSVNLGRSDAKVPYPLQRPWVTWITEGRIPAPVAGATGDRLLLADPAWREIALATGWSAAAVQVARWPGLAADPGQAMDAAAEGPVTLIADLADLSPPAAVVEMSSQRLLWESMREELLHDPFALTEPPRRYLSRCMEQRRIDPSSLSMEAWVQGIVTPAYQVGLVRRLMDAKVPVRTWGKGWEQVEQLGDAAGGAVGTREALGRAIREAGALIHGWPGWPGHPVISAGKPVLRARPGRGTEFIRAAEALGAPKELGAPMRGEPAGAVLSVELLRHAVRGESVGA